jgi:hypothetical protein
VVGLVFCLMDIVQWRIVIFVIDGIQCRVRVGILCDG